MTKGDKLVFFVLKMLKLPLITLIAVLVWIALMFDKLLKDPLFSILVVLGVLTILYGGELLVGNFLKITKRR